jgi:hypothetical protein
LAFFAIRKSNIHTLKTIAPGYQSSITYIVLAQDLYKDNAQGDEPEPLEVVEHQLSNLENLVYHEDLVITIRGFGQYQSTGSFSLYQGKIPC